jgi:uncharacterized membrane protein YoaK (UPF0700 family)
MGRTGNIGRETTAVALAASAGFVDAVGYLTLHHLFTAHMTGNASKLGIAIADGRLGAVLALAAAPLLFVAGVAAGAFLVDLGRTPLVFALQALLVAFFMGYGADVVHHGTVADHSVTGFYPLAAAATIGLGLQTAGLTEVDGETTRTTYLSGMLTRLGQGLVRRNAVRRLALLAALWIAYVGGAALGAYGLGAAGVWCLSAPLVILSSVALVAVRSG